MRRVRTRGRPATARAAPPSSLTPTGSAAGQLRTPPGYSGTGGRGGRGSHWWWHTGPTRGAPDTTSTDDTGRSVGHTVIEVPVTAAAALAVLAPVVTGVAAFAALAADWHVDVHRQAAPIVSPA